MKKRTILIISVMMTLSFLGLLVMQVVYMRSMAGMKREQFDESVHRALYLSSHNLEMDETLRYLEKDVNATERTAYRKDSIGTLSGNPDGTVQQSHQYSVVANDGTIYSSFELKTIAMQPTQMQRGGMLRGDKNTLSQATKTFQETIKNRYIYQKALLDEVVYNILYSASEKPLKERVNFKQLDQNLKAELLNTGIDIPFHFRVTTQDGREVYRCPDFTDDGIENTYTQVLFRNDPQSKMGVVKLHFPDMNSYIFSSLDFMVPSVVFSIMLLFTFVFTIVVIFRQKKTSEMRNDFINNMTHELKTPIASISLAAQMLNDNSISKSEQMVTHLGKTINDDTKRLRFLVEKVLQMSMFDRKSSTFRKKLLDINEMVENISQAFQLRVEHTGGHIYTEIGAVESETMLDEVHFQNVINNLLDNAVKYRKPDQPVDIYIKTWNEGERLCFSVGDTGLGMKKEDQKRVFEKFYRVHTGNTHDVKGFGLGLAYVKKVVELHDGTISVDSEPGRGTTFTIKLKIEKESK